MFMLKIINNSTFMWIFCSKVFLAKLNFKTNKCLFFINMALEWATL